MLGGTRENCFVPSCLLTISHYQVPSKIFGNLVKIAFTYVSMWGAVVPTLLKESTWRGRAEPSRGTPHGQCSEWTG